MERANKRALPKYVLAAIKPVFEKLTENELLQKCSHGGTQHANESLHMIWDRSPKTVFVGRNRLEISVYDAVTVFNEGEGARVKVFELLGLKCGQYMLETMRALDTKRVTSAAIQATKTSKLHMQQRKMSKTLEKDSV